jgi:Polyketide cyclase / dehydrase and lipid transport
VIRVFRSTVLPATVDRVWSIVRDFNALPIWLPAAVRSEIEGGLDPATIGCIRRVVADDNTVVRQRLTELSDSEYRCSYALLSASYPMKNYTATFQLRPVTDVGHCYMSWVGEFNVDPDKEADTIRFVGEKVFGGAFARLAALLAAQAVKP